VDAATAVALFDDAFTGDTRSGLAVDWNTQYRPWLVRGFVNEHLPPSLPRQVFTLDDSDPASAYAQAFGIDWEFGVLDPDMVTRVVPPMDTADALVGWALQYAFVTVVLDGFANQEYRYADEATSTPLSAAKSARKRAAQYREWSEATQDVLTALGDDWAELLPRPSSSTNRKALRWH